METVFIDTGAFFEFALARNQGRYKKVHSVFEEKKYRWYSSTYVFDELMTLVVKRVSKEDAILVGEKFRVNSLISWIHPSIQDEVACWDLFKSYQDKNWSFTDCTSLYLIRKYSIDWVLSFDNDFSQMGLKIL